jgi:hypothetical protein
VCFETSASRPDGEKAQKSVTKWSSIGNLKKVQKALKAQKAFKAQKKLLKLKKS